MRLESPGDCSKFKVDFKKIYSCISNVYLSSFFFFNQKYLSLGADTILKLALIKIISFAERTSTFDILLRMLIRLKVKAQSNLGIGRNRSERHFEEASN